jgi:hypothetical protein
MKKFASSFFLAMIATVFSAIILKAQSNAPASIILPPANWDVHKHILFILVTTNKPGNYSLQSAWVGVEKVTARSGYYANEREIMEETNRWFHFDRLTVCPGHIFPVVPEDRNICNSTNDADTGFSYRSSLPTDSELLGMRDVAAVNKFVGYKAFYTNHLGVFAGYFTLGPYNSIDTVNVEFNGGENSKIESMIVRRGHFNSE